MRYNLKNFNSAVEKYKKIFKRLNGKNVFIIADINDQKAYYSLAPLSRALHELGKDVAVSLRHKDYFELNMVKEIWKTYGGIKNNRLTRKANALKEFIEITDKKCKGKFNDIFEGPDLILEANGEYFKGDLSCPYNDLWFKKYRYRELLKTANVLWRQVYNVKRNERISIGFLLIPKAKDMGLPLEDYLDSYPICYAMAETIRKSHRVRMGSSTDRNSMLDKANPIGELRSTLLGCELCKEADEPIFKKFRSVSKLFKLNKMRIAQVNFFVAGKGYSGRHLFGDIIGYPSLNRKTRWSSPGQMIYRFDFYPQTSTDRREPKARVAFTETLPIDIFIGTCNVDWYKIKALDDKLIKIINKSQSIVVKANKPVKGYWTSLEVGLIKKDGTRRKVKGSDIEVRNLVNPHYYKETGIKAGNMGNIPGGEAFLTPEWIKGRFAGDVVISLDQSYMLSPKDPFVVDCFGNKYKIVRGPKKILKIFHKLKKEAWQRITEQEKNKSLPKSLIDMKKRNFNNIGEFAINTNPTARLCRYLIVNEKIAGMMHIALGSGYEADRATEYHKDIVIDCVRQQHDIYGIGKKGNKLWIKKKGRFVV